MRKVIRAAPSDPRPDQYSGGIRARMLGAIMNETQSKPWRDGWADANDELRGSAAYAAGIRDDKNQTKPWRQSHSIISVSNNRNPKAMLNPHNGTISI